MKYVLVMIVVAMLSACGTIGGAVAGAGKDLTQAGTWIQSKTGQ